LARQPSRFDSWQERVAEKRREADTRSEVPPLLLLDRRELPAPVPVPRKLKLPPRTSDDADPALAAARGYVSDVARNAAAGFRRALMRRRAKVEAATAEAVTPGGIDTATLEAMPASLRAVHASNLAAAAAAAAAPTRAPSESSSSRAAARARQDALSSAAIVHAAARGASGASTLAAFGAAVAALGAAGRRQSDDPAATAAASAASASAAAITNVTIATVVTMLPPAGSRARMVADALVDDFLGFDYPALTTELPSHALVALRGLDAAQAAQLRSSSLHLLTARAASLTLDLEDADAAMRSGGIFDADINVSRARITIDLERRAMRGVLSLTTALRDTLLAPLTRARSPSGSRARTASPPLGAAPHATAAVALRVLAAGGSPEQRAATVLTAFNAALREARDRRAGPRVLSSLARMAARLESGVLGSRAAAGDTDTGSSADEAPSPAAAATALPTEPSAASMPTTGRRGVRLGGAAIATARSFLTVDAMVVDDDGLGSAIGSPQFGSAAAAAVGRRRKSRTSTDTTSNLDSSRGQLLVLPSPRTATARSRRATRYSVDDPDALVPATSWWGGATGSSAGGALTTATGRQPRGSIVVGATDAAGVARRRRRSTRGASMQDILASSLAFKDRGMAARSLAGWKNVGNLFEGHGRYAEDDAMLKRVWAAERGILMTAEVARALADDALAANSATYVDANRAYRPAPGMRGLEAPPAEAYAGAAAPAVAWTSHSGVAAGGGASGSGAAISGGAAISVADTLPAPVQAARVVARAASLAAVHAHVAHAADRKRHASSRHPLPALAPAPPVATPAPPTPAPTPPTPDTAPVPVRADDDVDAASVRSGAPPHVQWAAGTEAVVAAASRRATIDAVVAERTQCSGGTMGPGLQFVVASLLPPAAKMAAGDMAGLRTDFVYSNAPPSPERAPPPPLVLLPPPPLAEEPASVVPAEATASAPMEPATESTDHSPPPPTPTTTVAPARRSVASLRLAAARGRTSSASALHVSSVPEQFPQFVGPLVELGDVFEMGDLMRGRLAAASGVTIGGGGTGGGGVSGYLRRTSSAATSQLPTVPTTPRADDAPLPHGHTTVTVGAPPPPPLPQPLVHMAQLPVVPAPAIHRGAVVAALERHLPHAVPGASATGGREGVAEDRPATPRDALASRASLRASATAAARGGARRGGRATSPWWEAQGYVPQRAPAAPAATPTGSGSTLPPSSELYRRLPSSQQRRHARAVTPLDSRPRATVTSVTTLEARIAASASLPLLPGTRAHALGPRASRTALPVALSPLTGAMPVSLSAAASSPLIYSTGARTGTRRVASRGGSRGGSRSASRSASPTHGAASPPAARLSSLQWRSPTRQVQVFDFSTALSHGGFGSEPVLAAAAAAATAATTGGGGGRSPLVASHRSSARAATPGSRSGVDSSTSPSPPSSSSAARGGGTQSPMKAMLSAMRSAGLMTPPATPPQPRRVSLASPPPTAAAPAAAGEVDVLSAMTDVWEALEVPTAFRVDFVLRYGTAESMGDMARAVALWQAAAAAVEVVEGLKAVVATVRAAAARADVWPLSDGSGGLGTEHAVVVLLPALSHATREWLAATSTRTLAERPAPTSDISPARAARRASAIAAERAAVTGASVVVEEGAWLHDAGEASAHTSAAAAAAVASAPASTLSAAFMLTPVTAPHVRALAGALAPVFDAAVAAALRACDAVTAHGGNTEVVRFRGVPYAAALRTDPLRVIEPPHYLPPPAAAETAM